ncbi:MAG: hypothetical protein L0H79_11540 [Intrasporangium sp.]|uniref:hypothetical protein n=1 Tax=Intrasporangium sp. TaxID=1925024 RepID=UPI0026485519|nr:hypothetical protein [Intrasporangium sp.]MDN5796368.1 hypothetical protein [Intrasporangium sp.]
MPTTRPRHAVTETPDIHEALVVAARRWPQDQGRPGLLLRRLIAEGRRSIEPQVADMRADRLAALHRVSGSYTGMYEPGYLDELRAEWPE